MTTIRDTNLSQTLDLTGKTISLPAALESVVLHPNRAAFPATGRLARLYLDDSTGTLWRWTGTVYSQITPGDLDAGTY
jgi:hypothetical protein